MYVSLYVTSYCTRLRVAMNVVCMIVSAGTLQWTTSPWCVLFGALSMCHGTCRCPPLQAVAMVQALLFEQWVCDMHCDAHCGTCNIRAMHPMALACSLPHMWSHWQAVSRASNGTGRCMAVHSLAQTSALLCICGTSRCTGVHAGALSRSLPCMLL